MLPAPNARSIVHMDLDAFFVAVECLKDPRLKGKPLVIGGGSKRGVVTSASYEARKFGIHSAMPGALARQLCPDAIFISGDMDAYSTYSRLVTEVIASEAPLYEKSSIDEFYIDATGMDKFFGVFQWAQELRKKVIHETGLPISMGVSANKMVSKVATGEYKPNGQKLVPHGSEISFLDPLAVTKIPMIGKSTGGFLNDMGIFTVKSLREVPLKLLENVFGKNGRALWQKARGIDHSQVVGHSERKSISTECTFSSDSIDTRWMKRMLIAMIEKIALTLRSEGKLTSCVTVKIRYTDFETVSKQVHLPYTACDDTIIQTAMNLFDQLYAKRLLIRLVGVRLSGLVNGHYQIHLFDDTEESIKLYQAMDHIRDKHGSDKLIRAATMDVSKRVQMQTNAFIG